MFSLKKHWYLLLVTTIVLINNTQTGIVSGWTSPILSVLEAPNSTIPTTPSEGAWMATVVPLVSVFAAPVAALSVQTLGRRVTLGLTCIPFLISWIMIAFATTAPELIYARAVSGIGQCFSFTVTPIYLAEIAPNHMRSSIGLCMTVANNIGILWIYSFGTAVSLGVSSVLCAMPTILYLVLHIFVPETPHYFVKNKQGDIGKYVLKKLRNGDVEKEFEALKGSIVQITFKESLKELCTKAQHRRALGITVMSLFISQFTGGVTFIFYAHLIFQKAGGNISANTMSMIKAVLQLISSVLSAFVVEKTGVRPLLMISCIGSSIFMAAEGVYFYLQDNSYNVESIWWLPLVAMILFNMSQVIGLQSVPINFLGELFNPDIKTLAVCISKSSLALSIFAVGQVFEILVNNFGNAVPFFVFGVMGLVGLVFVVFFVPETRGRSLIDIQFYLKHNTYDRKDDTFVDCSDKF